MDYTSHTGQPGEADGIALVDLNPRSRTFGHILQRVPLGPGVSPHHFYYNRDGSKLYTTALGGDRLYRLELEGDRIKQVTSIDTAPCQLGENLYFTEDGSKFYLTCMGSDRVLVFDAQTEKIIGQIQAPAPNETFIKHPHGLAVNEAIDRMIVTSTVSPKLDDPGASVTVIEPSSGKVLSTHPITKEGQGGTAPVEVFFLLLNLEKMNAGTISVVDLESGKLVAEVKSLVKAGLQPASLVLLGQPGYHY